MSLGFRICRVWGLGFQGVGFRVEDSEGLGFRGLGDDRTLDLDCETLAA